ncbi:MAG: YihY/virulence factor BrkB family protein [Oscillospiraceae bacterium]|nr:YihY/virulence factor BrkB family protein [Oscillospiraceae bacterium]
MKQPSRSSLVQTLLDVIRFSTGQNIPTHAAGTCYFLVLSVFPLLVLLLALLRYTGIQVQTLTDMISGFVPNALLPAAKRLIFSTYQNTSGLVIGVSAFTGLWSASRGLHSLRKGLNSIYQVEEHRSYLVTRGISILYTVLFLVMLVVTLVLNVFGTTLLQLLPLQNSSLLQFFWDVVDMRFLLMLFLQTALFTAMFMALPSGRHNSFLGSLPGAVLASAGWLVFSDLFSIYVENFSGYANIYGSVYAVALSMLWLYCCISIVFYGGALNSFLAARKKYK